MEEAASKDIEESLADIERKKGEELLGEVDEMVAGAKGSVKFIAERLEKIKEEKLATKKRLARERAKPKAQRSSLTLNTEAARFKYLSEKQEIFERRLSKAETDKGKVEGMRERIHAATKDRRVLENAAEREKIEKDLKTIFMQRRIKKGLEDMRSRISPEMTKRVKKAEKKVEEAKGEKAIKKAKEEHKKTMKESYAELVGNYERFVTAAYCDASAVYRQGWEAGLNGTQVLGGILSSEGYVLNILTGEGKTEFTWVPIAIATLTGYKAFAETSNANLAMDNHLSREAVFSYMGIVSELYTNNELPSDPTDRKKALERLLHENNGVHVVTFDTAVMNFQIATDMTAEESNKIIKKGRRFMFIVTDEIDASAREAATQYRIALPSEGMRPGGPKYNAIKEALFMANYLVRNTDKGREARMERRLTGDTIEEGESADTPFYEINKIEGRGITMNARGKRVIKALITERLQKHPELKMTEDEMLEWVEKCIDMMEQHDLDVDFAAANGEVKLYDSSGILGNRRLSDGRHTILEMMMKEIFGMDIQVQGDSASTSEVGGGVARSEYSAVHTGASGTAVASATDLKELYGCEKIIRVPRNIPSVIDSKAGYVINGKGDRIDMMRKWLEGRLREVTVDGKPRYELAASLMYIRNKSEADEVEKLLKEYIIRQLGEERAGEIEIQVVHGSVEGAALREAKRKAGRRNVITIFTDAGARGTDYQGFFKNLRIAKKSARAGNLQRLMSVYDAMEGAEGRKGFKEVMAFQELAVSDRFGSVIQDLLDASMADDEDRVEELLKDLGAQLKATIEALESAINSGYFDDDVAAKAALVAAKGSLDELNGELATASTISQEEVRKVVRSIEDEVESVSGDMAVYQLDRSRQANELLQLLLDADRKGTRTQLEEADELEAAVKSYNDARSKQDSKAMKKAREEALKAAAKIRKRAAQEIQNIKDKSLEKIFSNAFSDLDKIIARGIEATGTGVDLKKRTEATKLKKEIEDYLKEGNMADAKSKITELGNLLKDAGVDAAAIEALMNWLNVSVLKEEMKENVMAGNFTELETNMGKMKNLLTKAGIDDAGADLIVGKLRVALSEEVCGNYTQRRKDLEALQKGLKKLEDKEAKGSALGDFQQNKAYQKIRTLMGRGMIEQRFEEFFNKAQEKLEAAIADAKGKEQTERVKVLVKQLQTLQEFKIDVSTRYIEGFGLLAQVSDKSMADLLQAIGRVARQSDPAQIALFLDAEEGGADYDGIIGTGFGRENDKALNAAIEDMNMYRSLTNFIKVMDERDVCYMAGFYGRGR